MSISNIRRLRICFLLVDVGFVAYWLCVWLHLFPDAYLFKDYGNPILQAWNLSFLPLDLLVSASGLGSLWLQARGRAGWQVLALVSLSLTMCSGLQALAFWAIRDDYDMIWWAPNLFLFIYPFFFIGPVIARSVGQPTVAGQAAHPSSDATPLGPSQSPPGCKPSTKTKSVSEAAR